MDKGIGGCKLITDRLPTVEEVSGDIRARLQDEQYYKWNGDSSHHGDLHIIILRNLDQAMLRVYRGTDGKHTQPVYFRDVDTIIRLAAIEIAEYLKILNGDK